MFDDDFDKLVKALDRQRRAMLTTVCFLLFAVTVITVALSTISGCASPDMTDREAASIVELLRR